MEQDKETKILNMQMLEARFRELEEQLMLLERQINELQVCSLAIDELKNMKKGNEMFAPIGPGMFVRAVFDDSDEVVIDTGARTFVKKNRDDTRKFLQERLDKATAIHGKLMQEINLVVKAIEANSA